MTTGRRQRYIGDAVEKNKKTVGQKRPSKPSLFSLLPPYRSLIFVLVVFTILGNALNLVVPKVIAHTIDAYGRPGFVLSRVLIEFFLVSVGIFVFAYVAEHRPDICRGEDRQRFTNPPRREEYRVQDNAFIQQSTPAKLLTNLTSDVDAIKSFVSQAIASMISSIFLIIGAGILLLSIDWRLGLAVLAILPVIGITFSVVLGKVRKLFIKGQGAIDWLNKVINESILGSSLIRLLNSQQYEYQKFLAANTEAKEISLSILRLFASLIPVIVFSTNVATLTILTMGGRFVINGSMTLGDFTAFNSYLAILIFPVIIIGFMSNVVAQATASFIRLSSILEAPVPSGFRPYHGKASGRYRDPKCPCPLRRKSGIERCFIRHEIGNTYGRDRPDRRRQDSVALSAHRLDPVRFGKRRVRWTCGRRVSEGRVPHRQIGFVFQDSIIFNLTLRENIAFSTTVTDKDLEKAISTAELNDFIDSLPQRMDTIVSERGTSLSGGQKQRIMLARALALNPRILLLDDFTARVDATTERKILQNVRDNYPGITWLSVTQQISAVEDYDQIVLLMEGEVLALGTHHQLMETSPEYVQIYDSQRSTSHYELVHAE